LHHSNPTSAGGFGDLGALVKYRVLSGNEQQGNYVVTPFLGMTFPTGGVPHGATYATFTPSIAYGKGWGKFDLQGAAAGGLPTQITATLGRTFTANDAVQLHAGRYLWPELEMNATHFFGGVYARRTQVFVTPALLIGRLHVWRRMALTAGAGFQIAATKFHTSNHNVIVSIRLPF